MAGDPVRSRADSLTTTAAGSVGQPLLVAVTGTDGAGKTTVTRSVFGRLDTSSSGVAISDRWDIVTNAVSYPTARFLPNDVPLLRQCLTDMSPLSRLLFLVWTMNLSIVDRVPGADRSLLVTDSYWMKHAASEVVYGLDRNWVRTVCDGLPTADTVVYLRVSPEVAWRRIGAATNAYECGMDRSCSRQAFLRHQRAMQEVLDEWGRAGNWVVVDADEPLASVCGRVLDTIDSAIGVAGAVEHG